jgi:hypothetical protein
MRTALLKDPDIQRRIVGVDIPDAPPPMDDSVSTDPDTAAAAPP